jgi:uncharacterized membrane protein YccC
VLENPRREANQLIVGILVAAAIAGVMWFVVGTTTTTFAKVVSLGAAAFFAFLAYQSFARGGWFNFAGGLFFSVICWYICNQSKKLY